MLKFGVAVPPGKLLLAIGIVVTQCTPSILFSLDAKPFPRQQLYSLVKCDDGAFARKGEVVRTVGPGRMRVLSALNSVVPFQDVGLIGDELRVGDLGKTLPHCVNLATSS